MSRVLVCMALLSACAMYIASTDHPQAKLTTTTMSDRDSLEAVAVELRMTKEERAAFLFEPGDPLPTAKPREVTKEPEPVMEKVEADAVSSNEESTIDDTVGEPEKDWDEIKAQPKTLPFPEEWKSPKGPVPVKEGWVMKNTTNGYYVYKPNGEFKDKYMVVMGGNLYDETNELVERGYAVWRTHVVCVDTRPMMCHEHYGYFRYLTDPERPNYDVVNFIHGHKYAWHQLMGFKGLALGSTCAEKTGRFEPHVKHESHFMYSNIALFNKQRGTGKARPYKRVTLHAFPEQRNTAILWNRHFASDPKINIRGVNPDHVVGHWCCGTFALPKRVVELHTREEYSAYYQKLLSLIITKAKEGRTVVDGYFIERTWHLLFGEPQDVNPRIGWRNCSDIDPPEFELIR